MIPWTKFSWGKLLLSLLLTLTAGVARGSYIESGPVQSLEQPDHLFLNHRPGEPIVPETCQRLIDYVGQSYSDGPSYTSEAMRAEARLLWKRNPVTAGEETFQLFRGARLTTLPLVIARHLVDVGVDHWRSESLAGHPGVITGGIAANDLLYLVLPERYRETLVAGMIQVHELEHMAQLWDPDLATGERVSNIYEFIKIILARIKAEKNCLRGEWEFLQLVPPEERVSLARRISSDEELDPMSRRMLSQALNGSEAPFYAFYQQQSSLRKFDALAVAQTELLKLGHPGKQFRDHFNALTKGEKDKILFEIHSNPDLPRMFFDLIQKFMSQIELSGSVAEARWPQVLTYTRFLSLVSMAQVTRIHMASLKIEWDAHRVWLHSGKTFLGEMYYDQQSTPTAQVIKARNFAVNETISLSKALQEDILTVLAMSLALQFEVTELNLKMQTITGPKDITLSQALREYDRLAIRDIFRRVGATRGVYNTRDPRIIIKFPQ